MKKRGKNREQDAAYYAAEAEAHAAAELEAADLVLEWATEEAPYRDPAARATAERIAKALRLLDAFEAADWAFYTCGACQHNEGVLADLADALAPKPEGGKE